jgi:hypothetical protein
MPFSALIAVTRSTATGRSLARSLAVACHQPRGGL